MLLKRYLSVVQAIFWSVQDGSSSFLFLFQASTANDRITVPRRPVETEPSVARSRAATSARVHPASRDRIARTTSTSVTGIRADTVPARIFTDLTSKSNTTRLNTPSTYIERVSLSRFRNDYTNVCSQVSISIGIRRHFFFQSSVLTRILKMPLHDYQWNAAFEVLEEPDFLIISVCQCLWEKIIWLVDILTRRIEYFFFKYQVSR